MSFSPVPQTQEKMPPQVSYKGRVSTLIFTIIGGLMIAFSVLATWIIVNTYTNETVNGLSQPRIAATFTKATTLNVGEIKSTLTGGWVAIALGVIVIALAVTGFFIKKRNIAVVGMVIGVIALIFSVYNIVQISNYTTKHFDTGVGGIGIGPFLVTFGAIIALTGSFMTFIVTPTNSQ